NKEGFSLLELFLLPTSKDLTSRFSASLALINIHLAKSPVTSGIPLVAEGQRLGIRDCGTFQGQSLDLILAL
ncbi:hypothetical protein J6590_035459, partial [Homalodisca vitripennis]